MKFSIERAVLLKAVAQAQSVVERRNTIPILANVLIEAEGDNVQFRATDLDIEVVDRAPAKVERAGATTVAAVTLNEIVRKLPDGALVPGSAWRRVRCASARQRVATVRKLSPGATVTVDGNISMNSPSAALASRLGRPATGASNP